MNTTATATRATPRATAAAPILSPDAPYPWTTTEAAAYLGCLPGKVARLARRREIASVLVGASRRFRKSDLDDYLASTRVEPPASPATSTPAAETAPRVKGVSQATAARHARRK